MQEEKQKESFHWRSAIAYKTIDRLVVRGYDSNELARHLSFTELLLLLFTGELPTEAQAKMMNYKLISMCEHAFSPSAVSARMVASGRPLLSAAIAGGMLTMGDAHGPGQKCAEMLREYVERAKRENKSLDEMAEILVREHGNRRIYGMHQPQHLTGDPRVPKLLAMADELGISGDHIYFVKAIERAIKKVRGKKIYMNMVGAGTALDCDLGLSPMAGWAIGILARGFSCAAHAIEEMERESPWRASTSQPTVSLLDLSLQGPRYYDGPPDRELTAEYKNRQLQR